MIRPVPNYTKGWDAKGIWEGPFQYCTLGELEYVARLAALGTFLVAFCNDLSDMEDSVLCFVNLHLSVDFQFIEKSCLPYWRSYVRNERRAWVTTKFTISGHSVMQNGIARPKRKTFFEKLAVDWFRAEVRKGFNVELWPVFSYKLSELTDLCSGFWVVVYTEFDSKMTAFTFFDAFNDFLSLWLSHRNIVYLWNKNLKPISGSNCIVEEFECMMSMIGETTFGWMLKNWIYCSKQRAEPDLSSWRLWADRFH